MSVWACPVSASVLLGLGVEISTGLLQRKMGGCQTKLLEVVGVVGEDTSSFLGFSLLSLFSFFIFAYLYLAIFYNKHICVQRTHVSTWFK